MKIKNTHTKKINTNLKSDILSQNKKKENENEKDIYREIVMLKYLLNFDWFFSLRETRTEILADQNKYKSCSAFKTHLRFQKKKQKKTAAAVKLLCFCFIISNVLS